MLTTHKKGSEKKLLDITSKLKNQELGYYAVHFRFCELMEHYKTDYQLKISVNIITDIMRDAEGDVVVTSDFDIFVVCKDITPNVIKKMVFQLRYLYMDDPLAYNEEGEDNQRFCQTYDLKQDWNDFYAAARFKYSELDKVVDTRKIKNVNPLLLTPERLVEIESELGKNNIASAIRKQPVCVVRPDGYKVMFNEIYINISALAGLLNTETSLVSNRHLFKYLTNILDRRMLELIQKTPHNFLRGAASINLNVETLLSDAFAEFSRMLDEKSRQNLVLEIQISDVFSDMQAFLAARDHIKKMGFRICIDGMDILSFQQVDRSSLGFDLAKINWNAEIKSDLRTSENKKLVASIESCGKSRVILCRCDSIGAVYYGQSLGISLFQGRHLDFLVGPNTDILN